MKTICTAAAIGLSAVALLAAQQQSQARAGEGGIEVLQLRPNFYMLVGAGGNIAVQVGADGAVVVDAGSAARAPAVVGTIKQLSPGPIRYVINTNADADHVGGNETVARAGQSLLTAPDSTGAGPAGAAIMSAHSVLARMSAPTGQQAPFAEGAWPTETFDKGRKYMLSKTYQLDATPVSAVGRPCVTS